MAAHPPLRKPKEEIDRNVGGRSYSSTMKTEPGRQVDVPDVESQQRPPTMGGFSTSVSSWFQNAFSAPTPAQVEAWQAIRSGANVLVIAPTGSEKRWLHSCGLSTAWHGTRVRNPRLPPGCGSFTFPLSKPWAWTLNATFARRSWESDKPASRRVDLRLTSLSESAQGTRHLLSDAGWQCIPLTSSSPRPNPST